MPRIALAAAALTTTVALVTAVASGALAAGPLAGGLPGPIVASPPSASAHSPLSDRPFPEPTRLPVYAVMGTRLLVGESRPDPIGAGGALVLKDQAEPGYSCIGRYLAAGRPNAWSQRTEGAARLDCTDGAQFQVAYHGTLGDSGVGCGSAYAQTVSLCYGFAAKAAARRLTAPPGYELVAKGGKLSMKPSGA